MMKFIATVLRELRQLSRDRAGLIMLFVMPAALVLIITLVQDNVFRNVNAIFLQVPTSFKLIQRIVS